MVVGKMNKIKMQPKEARCLNCGSTSLKYRKRFDDFVCLKCGDIFVPMM
jgi:predicted RNA-binding Zn-ribbon protein involved in translation (DUF1610 family)